jgi:hypothetical protein
MLFSRKHDKRGLPNILMDQFHTCITDWPLKVAKLNVLFQAILLSGGGSFVEVVKVAVLACTAHLECNID